MGPARARMAATLALTLGACGRIDFGARRDAAPGAADALAADAAPGAADAAPGAADAAQPGLIARYTLDDPDGPAADTSGNGLDARCPTLGCPPRIANGRVGAARTFSAGDRLLVDDARLALTTGFTVAAFVRQPVVNNVGTVLAKPHATGVGAAFELALAGGQTWFCTRPAVDVGAEECLITEALPTGLWVHVALTWDGGLKRMYVNGDLVGEVPGVTTFDAQPLVLGADAEDGQPFTTPFTGDLDEVHLFDRALTAAEVAALALP